MCIRDSPHTNQPSITNQQPYTYTHTYPHWLPLYCWLTAGTINMKNMGFWLLKNKTNKWKQAKNEQKWAKCAVFVHKMTIARLQQIVLQNQMDHYRAFNVVNNRRWDDNFRVRTSLYILCLRYQRRKKNITLAHGLSEPFWNTQTTTLVHTCSVSQAQSMVWTAVDLVNMMKINISPLPHTLSERCEWATVIWR